MLAPSDGKEFLGIGWWFPPLLDAGHVGLARYEDDVEQSIRIILGTNPGERLMRPTFGAGLEQFLFEPISTTTMQRLRTRVEQALVDWEPRIKLESVGVEPHAGIASRLDIEVRYTVRATNNQFNLVYPFYIEEGAAVVRQVR
jgi:phage baseplate assembly protein W